MAENSSGNLVDWILAETDTWDADTDEHPTPPPSAAEQVSAEREADGASHLSVAQGADPVKVGGADGWYGGDSVTQWTSEDRTARHGQAMLDAVTGRALGDAMPPERVEDAIRQAGADWQVSLSPVRYATHNGIRESENRRVIVRGPRQSYIDAGEDDPLAGADLGIVGGRNFSKWEPLQPQSPYRLIAAAGAPIARGGEMRGGAQVWAQSPAGVIDVPGDSAALSLYAMEDLTGSGSFELCATATIAACQNYIRSILRIAKRNGLRVSIRHNASAEEKLSALADTLRRMRESAREFSAEAFELARHKIKDGDREKVEAKLFGDRNEKEGKALTQHDNRVSKLRESIDLGAIADETLRHTLWGLGMGISHYATHQARTRKSTDEAQAWLDDNGSRAKVERMGMQVVEEILAERN